MLIFLSSKTDQTKRLEVKTFEYSSVFFPYEQSKAKQKKWKRIEESIEKQNR